jgi:hypothetical protein
MKIISKYKDYYDYLMGIYGSDPKLILDRRNFESYEFFHPTKITIYLCGMVYEGFYNGEYFFYGDSLLQLGELARTGWGRINIKQVRIKYEKYSDHSDTIDVALTPYRDVRELNKEFDCPILVNACGYGDPLKWFPLNKINFSSVMKPEEIFILLSSYLSEKITEKELIVDSRTNEEHIESRGFDKKRSFRPNMK